ncbi:MAG: hypothetical protein R3330_19235 [Saprospiraceae bacterium]|nr:hypothetical protein [Saprospiraceae bacterium]
MTVFKTIINDDNGTETDENAFGLMVDGNPVLHNVSNPFDAGPHTVSEAGLPGYDAGPWGGDCNSDGTITLELGQDATCTITNDDSEVTSLTLVKEVVNDNGGNATAPQWTLNAAGPTPLTGPGPMVTSGEDFLPGTYDLSETGGAAGYDASAWVCVGGTQDDDDTITLQLGEAAVCTITNDDISPTITVVKTIVNDHGGTETDENAFNLRVDGQLVQHNVPTEFDAGPHTVSEDGLSGYTPGPWGGDCNPDGTITLSLDQDAVCTITNDDLDPAEILIIDGFESTKDAPVERPE